MILQVKYFSCYILLTDQISLSPFTSWDIGQYAYCNCLLTRLWRYKKNQSISRKHGGFRTVFKLVRKTIFEQTCVITWGFFVGYNQSLQWVIWFGLIFLIMLHMQTLIPLLLFSINFGLPGENLVTSTI